MKKEIKYKNLTYQIIGSAMEVHKVLGNGFLESVYELAFCIELEKSDITFQNQVGFPVVYKGINIKSFVCDLVIDNKVIVELKSIKKLTNIERSQILNYLKVTGLEVGLLINFGRTSLEYERFIL